MEVVKFLGKLLSANCFYYILPYYTASESDIIF